MPQFLLVSELAEHVGILTLAKWHDVRDVITPEEILAYVGDIPPLPDYDWDYFDPDDPQEKRNEHIQRIRWLMQNPDKWKPVQFDENRYGIPELCDGHHRLYAAVLLKLKVIQFDWAGTWKSYCDAFPRSYRRMLFRQRFEPEIFTAKER